MKRSFFEDRPVAVGWIIFFVALALKFFYSITLENLAPYRGDSFFYIHYADNLLEHGVFSKDVSDNPVPDSYWAPGYPFFLASCLKLSEFLGLQFYTFIIFMQAVLGAFITALTFSVGRFFMPGIYALVGALLTAFSPHLMTLGGEILSEILFCALLLAGIYFYLLHLNKSTPKLWGCIAGFAFGFAYLANPVSLVVPIFLVIRYLFVQRNIISSVGLVARKPLMPALLSLVCFVAVIFSWAIRDWVNVPDSQKATSDRAFENLVIGAHSNFHTIWRADPRDPKNPADLDQKKYKDDHASFYKELGSRIVSEPAHYMNWYFIQKPLELWGWDILVGRGGIFVSSPNATLYDKSTVVAISLKVMKEIHYWLFGLALVGLFFAMKEMDSLRKESVIAVYLSVISVSAVYVVLHSDARYSVPLRPEMYLCSLYAIYKLISLVRHRKVANSQTN